MRRTGFVLGATLAIGIAFMSVVVWGATLYDSFADGDFTASPAWGGNTSAWTIVANSDAAAGATGSNTLRLNSTGGATVYLSSQISTWGTSQEWGCWVGRRGQAFTAANQSYIWLYANESTLTSATVDGYRLAIGDNSGGDNIRLEYIVNGAVSATVITSTGSVTNDVTDIGFLVRVTRSASGSWEVFTSSLPTTSGTGAIATDTPDATNAPTSQGTATHNTLVPAASGYIGVAALHSTGASAIIGAEFDQIYFTDTSAPTITTSVSSLPDFGAVTVGSSSAEQSYTVSGSGLTANITINAPTDFEISTTSGSGFGSTVTLTQTGGTVSSTPIFVRFSPGSTGPKVGNITHDSTGATQKLVAVSGTGTGVLAGEPTVQATNVQFSAVTTNSMTVSWTIGDGASRIVLAKSGSAVDSNPVDGNTYTANAAFGSGTQIGTGNFVVFSGSGNSVNVTGLAAGTTYHFAVYEFNGSGGTENYLATAPATGNQATLFAQYRTAGSGAWGAASTWEVSNDGGANWVPAASTPTSADGAVTVRNGHTVNVAAAVSVDEVTVDAGGQITIDSGATLTLANGTGTDLVINGTVLNAGTFTLSGSTWSVGAGGTWIQNTLTGISASLPSATLDAASTFIYRGSSTMNVGPSISGRTYGNLSFESTSGSYTPVSGAGGSPLTVNGSLSIGVIGAGTVSYSTSAFASAINIANNVSIGTGSTLTVGSSTITVSGTSWANSGSFVPGSSTVVFNGNNNTQTLSGTNTFNHLTINHTGTGGVTAVGSTLAVNGLLNVQAGTFTSASDYTDVTIAPAGTFVLSANITVSGNWTNDGTFTPNGFTVTFDGTGTQTITTGGTGAGKPFAGFAVNKTSGTATLAGDLSATTLTVTDGAFNQGATFSVTTGTTSVAATGSWTNTGTGDLTLSGNVSNAGTITFNANGASCGDADDILIRSSVGGTQRTWSGAGTFSMTDVNVQDQSTPVVPPPVAIVVFSGTDAGNNTGWSFTGVCTAGTYTWVGTVDNSWIVAANWTPTRAVPAAGDVLIIDANATPGPIIGNVPTETIAALRLVNGPLVTLQTTVANTLTISGATGTDLTVPAGSLLTLDGSNGITIKVSGTGSIGTIGGTFIVQGGPHRLFGDTNGVITFQSGALGSTGPGATGNPFGTGVAGDGDVGSVIFASGSIYSHNAGDSPFGTVGNGPVVTFQTGSLARWFSNSGFQASGRTYANLQISAGLINAFNVSDSGSGNFQFDNLEVKSTGSANSSLTFNGTGSSTVTIQGNITSTGTGTGTAVSDVSLTAGSGGIVLNNVATHTFSGGSPRTITFGSNATLNTGATLTLSRNLIVSPSASVFTITSGATFSAGSGGYVIGNLRKTPPLGVTTFEVGTANGYSPVSVDVTTLNGTPTFTVSATNSYMTGITDTSRAIQRFWTLDTTAPAGDLVANLTFQYVPGAPAAGDESVNVDRNTLNVFRRNGNGSINDLGATSRVTTTSPPPSVTINGVNAFSDWTLANGGSVITYARLRSFEAISTNGGNVVQWHTSYEVDNLGFNLYRLKAGKLVRVTPSLVAGSALMAGPKTTMTAGMSYSWRDPKGQPDSEYYLEDVELNGSRTMNGPIVPVAVEKSKLTIEKQAALLSELNQLDTSSRSIVTGRPAAQRLAPESIRAVPTGKPNGSTTDRMSIVQDDPLAKQRALAGGSAVKMAVRQTGWYRVTQSELVAAGLSPNVDPNLLQLYVDGREQPILVQTGQNGFGADAAIEFYGTGMDTASTDARTYWLVAGSQPGRRINVDGSNSSANAENSKDEGISMTQELPLTSYGYTVERKDRTIYFASLLNGDAENFFGAVITNTPTIQNLSLSNIDHTVSGPGTLEVALQGGSAKPHQVKVLFNGIEMGVMNFNGQEHQVQQFQIPRPYLVDGNNSVTLEALGGDSDVSVVDVIRLTYYHTYRAENDSLLFSTEHKTTVVDGFTNPRIRVFDVTNADAIAQLPAKVSPSGSGYAVKIPGGKGTTRVLLALTDAQMLHPAGIAANESSNLSDTENRADFIILTHRDFRDAVGPLAAMRRNQGLETMVVTVEDVYDEFSYGAPSRDAIKAFFAWTRSNWASGPRYVLLVGDASADPRNYLKTGRKDFVPTRLIDTKLLETASDDALVDFNNDGLAEISIGRLPAQTLEQAQKMIGRITSYVPGQSSAGALLVSDHYEGYDFETANDRIRALLPTNMPVGIVNRGERAADQVRGEIIAGINQGPMIVNYLGHGSVEVWTGSGILRSADTPLLTNGQRTPFFVTMTCLNGYFQDVYTESLAEALMKADNGGAVAVWASSGLTEPEGQALMDQQLMRLLFGSDQSQPIGDAVRGAKAATTDIDVRKTWILFGDPTMRLR